MIKTVPIRIFEPALLACAIAVGLTVTAGATWSHLVQSAELQESSVGDLPDVTIETANGARTSFAATNGHVRIATMFYTHCPGVCPLTIASLRHLESQLSASERAKVEFVLLSVDPTHDTPQVLRALARERGIAATGWLLGRASQADTQRFADAAKIRYRVLSDGSVDHSSSLVLIDARGRVVTRVNDVEGTEELVAAVRNQLGNDHGDR